jgi:hypothetical protein
MEKASCEPQNVAGRGPRRSRRADGKGVVRAAGNMGAEMPSDETRRVLKVFGVAVTNLEDAIDHKAKVADIMKWDAEVADRTREVLALVERLRSRRIG